LGEQLTILSADKNVVDADLKISLAEVVRHKKELEVFCHSGIIVLNKSLLFLSAFATVGPLLNRVKYERVFTVCICI